MAGEKNLLQMINACVSHEMRNPINSIQCQNYKIEELAKTIRDLVKGNDINTIHRLKKEIQSISEELTDSSKIQLASTKLLNFYVGDMLSLAQINSKKFRKDNSNINLKDTIEEVMMIQAYKAESFKIDMQTQFIGFPEKPIVCTDQQRFQQVLLNFQSNALKFTPQGGKITITAELFKDLGTHGTVKVSIKDNGVGIKEDDQAKLFQLFGFLEATKEINTKGVGLGLYICKRIVNIFGGDVGV